MEVVKRFYVKEFSGDDTKQAYLKACKWVAKNVISKVEIGKNTLIKYIKNADLPTVTVELYCVFDEKETGEKYCNICKEFHKTFYINQEYNCNACKMKGYMATIDKKLLIKMNYIKQRLSYVLNKKIKK